MFSKCKLSTTTLKKSTIFLSSFSEKKATSPEKFSHLISICCEFMFSRNKNIQVLPSQKKMKKNCLFWTRQKGQTMITQVVENPPVDTLSNGQKLCAHLLWIVVNTRVATELRQSSAAGMRIAALALGVQLRSAVQQPQASDCRE